ncbi:hypothetical protein CF386_11295 [Paraphotobacterium marinum]|uniref:Major facilitator superfamily (MFS) profile domain-containing protein n=1 Tax=Paraphotobacterium marinum TaxID=1755811 RepID=A0A220VHH4_9GAMM|nr:MFS transporter [Paraphotobacterium marinum]ASK79632.1 hypothetical protein CF386_11295 [Paraphotobacterium marinum]
MDRNKLIILLLFLTIVIDIMGVGIIIPLMPDLFFGNKLIFQFDNNLQFLAYGLAMAIWPLGLVLGAPIIGELSDKFGRKKLIILSLVFTAISYFIIALSIETKNFYLFIFARLLGGIFAGSFEVAQAYTVDISSSGERAKNMGYIIIAANLGTIIGPILSGIINDPMYNLPIYTVILLAGILSIINACLVKLFLSVDQPKFPSLKISLLHCLKTIFFLFSDKRVNALGLVFILMQLGYGLFYLGVPVFLQMKFDYSVQFISFYFAVMGIAVVLFAFFQEYLFKALSEVKLYIISSIICSISFLVITQVTSNYFYLTWILGALSSVSQLIAYTSSITLLSKKVSEKEQGKLMGGAGAGFGLAWFISSLMIGKISEVSIKLPLYYGSVFFILSILFLCLFRYFKQFNNFGTFKK